MNFTPKTEKEIQEDGLLAEGIYDFEVAEAENKTSAKGNDMIELKLHVFDGNGNPRIVMDYLLASIMYKLRHAADACQVLDKYDAGSLDASDFLGKSGKVKIKIDKDKTGQYADKNGVKDYVKRENMVEAGNAPKVAADLDDEIPFALVLGLLFAAAAPFLNIAGIA